MVLVQEGKRIEPEQVINGRGSLAGLLEKLAAEPGQWMEFENITNPGIATQIKKHKGFDSRIKCVQKAAMENGKQVAARYKLQACYIGPEFQAEIAPRMRKPKPTIQIEHKVPFPSKP